MTEGTQQQQAVSTPLPSPEAATEDLKFEAIYEDELYTVTFKADTDEDGEYETIVSEETFLYGEKIYTEFAPENYPIDAWEFEDGTEFVFSLPKK